jgi:hypothetical protein
LNVAELYFDDEMPERLPAVDLVRFLAIADPTSDRCWDRRHTLTVDLTPPEDRLFDQLSGNTRYKVRRAMLRDQVTVTMLDSPTVEQVERFADYYDEFAGQKGLRPVFRPRLQAMRRSGMLLLSYATREAARPLVWHAYAAGSGHALLLYSASLFRDRPASGDRNMIGRANRYLHWHDMIWCKAAGHHAYDLGGIDVTDTDPVKRRINEFKRGFGGEVRPTHTCTVGVSAKGRVATRMLRLRGVSF